MRFKFVVPGAAVVFAACLGAPVALAHQLPQYVGYYAFTRIGDPVPVRYHAECAAALQGYHWWPSEMIIGGGASSIAPLPGAGGERGVPVVLGPVAAKGVIAISPVWGRRWQPQAPLRRWRLGPRDHRLIFLVGRAPSQAIFDLGACSVPRFAACCGRLRDESDD